MFFFNPLATIIKANANILHTHIIFFINLQYSLNNRYLYATIKIIKWKLNYIEGLVGATSTIHGETPFEKVSLHTMKSRHLWNAGSISKTRPSIVTTSRNLLRVGKGKAHSLQRRRRKLHIEHRSRFLLICFAYNSERRENETRD